MSKQEKQDKLRVYEYAKSLNMSSKEIITILKRLNIPVNNHMSVMENDAVARVEQFFKDIKSNAAAKRESSGRNESSAKSPAPASAGGSQTPKATAGESSGHRGDQGRGANASVKKQINRKSR